jgi:hypothetical protein
MDFSLKAYHSPGHRMSLMVGPSVLVIAATTVLDCLQICAGRLAQRALGTPGLLGGARGALARRRAGRVLRVRARGVLARRVRGVRAPCGRIRRCRATGGVLRCTAAGGDAGNGRAGTKIRVRTLLASGSSRSAIPSS